MQKIVLDTNELALLSKDFEESLDDDGLLERIANSSEQSDLNNTKRIVMSSRARFDPNGY